MSEVTSIPPGARIWQVGALCRAIADALEARFNPVAVRGEITAFSRAASGHCYFSLKDESGQIRCAMFRRTTTLLDFLPRDGELVELHGRLDVYSPRGDLQLIVESIRKAGSGALFEQFLQLKSKLEAQGLFDTLRKRSIPEKPRGIGVVTSLGAAALHDVVSVLRRRVPHIPVLLAPASVQGANAPQELIGALLSLYSLVGEGRLQRQGLAAYHRGTGGDKDALVIEVILLVRGGGSMEDLWAFNDEQLALAMAQSPVPIVCGIGHETDFTIADFIADLRAPTPTAAAELVAQPRSVLLDTIDALARRGQDAAIRHIDRQSQRLDVTASRLGRPSVLLAQQRLRLVSMAQRLHFACERFLEQRQQELGRFQTDLPVAILRGLSYRKSDLELARIRLSLLDPSLVLRRGYAWLTGADREAITSVRQIHLGQIVRATLADGEVDLTLSPPN